ncbi:CRISPR-associated helicase Cas3' [Fulvivirga maritima]|uniref:CRISPR-associated helicase Cas3' n=1 Tax=Fulvivirga maritima TaxID=2904247 RepID=UPI001F353F61|nr:CRISPR-associated helicase Cas3' [Fulvivirga maritima]UII27650.1 CRISPR-associated helicase Cas3' [Fulvivirga maritima]
MLSQIFAKYQTNRYTGAIETETLIEHTEYVLEALIKLKKRTPDLPDDFWQAAYITCLFHDSGKLARNFQNSLGHHFGDEKMRHELFSGIILWFFSKEFFFKKDKFVAALYSHHKPLNSELINKDNSSETQIILEDLMEWFEFVDTKIYKQGKRFKKPSRDNIERFSLVTPNLYRNLFLHKYFDHFKNNWRPPDRLKYIYAKAVLNISDWSASGHFNLAKPLIYDNQTLLDSLKNKLRQEGKTVDNPAFKKFQLDSKIESNVLAIAPTGSGKTEASLIWASQKREFDKIIYCLPTRVTSNAIYKRLIAYFGKENCSIVHSSALLYQKEVDKDYESRKYLRDKTFFSNITICTIDQLLTQGFNLGFWEVKTFHCRNARIVIDEIHLYSPYTLALILQTIKYLREQFNAKFYIMSATLPTKLKKLLAEALGGSNYKLIQDFELLGRSRNQFEVRNIPIQENMVEVKKAIKNYDKVLIVVNTVNQAIDLYEELKPFAKNNDRDCICFHSRFIQKDRQQIETNILDIEEEGKSIVLIATQVVEVSLDIDFDILFTENAPIDAIIQRAGRVNRKRKSEKDSKVIVHLHSEVTQKYVYTEADILDKTFEVLNRHNETRITEGDFLNFVDEVYQDIDIIEKLSFKEGWGAFNKVQSTYYFLGDCPPESEDAMTRDGLDTVSVIPICFYEELQLDDVDRSKKVRYELSITKGRYKNAKITVDKDGFKYVNYRYDAEVGLVYNNGRNVDVSFQTY